MFGFLTLLLTLLGLEFTYMAWLERLPGLMPLMIKLLMLFGGIVLAYLSSTDWKSQHDEY